MFKEIIPIVLSLTIIGAVAEAKGVYKLLGKAPLGSKLKPVEARAPYPFDKEYRQLSKKQKDIYRTQWEGLNENDTPPFPKGGTKSIYLPLIKGHERIARGGMLRLVAQIDKNGIVQELVIYESPHKDITELATSVMFHTRFDPATCVGKPCKMDFPFEFKLRMRAKNMNTLNSEDIPGRAVQ
jgi:hypothetical protein